jgi:hypothetical protein
LQKRRRSILYTLVTLPFYQHACMAYCILCREARSGVKFAGASSESSTRVSERRCALLFPHPGAHSLSKFQLNRSWSAFQFCSVALGFSHERHGALSNFTARFSSRYFHPNMNEQSRNMNKQRVFLWDLLQICRARLRTLPMRTAHGCPLTRISYVNWIVRLFLFVTK